MRHFTTFGESNDQNIPLHQKLVLPKGERQNVDIAGLVVKNFMQCSFQNDSIDHLLVKGVVLKVHVARHIKVHPCGVADLPKEG